MGCDRDQTLPLFFFSIPVWPYFHLVFTACHCLHSVLGGAFCVNCQIKKAAFRKPGRAPVVGRALNVLQSKYNYWNWKHLEKPSGLKVGKCYLKLSLLSLHRHSCTTICFSPGIFASFFLFLHLACLSISPNIYIYLGSVSRHHESWNMKLTSSRADRTASSWSSLSWLDKVGRDTTTAAVEERRSEHLPWYLNNSYGGFDCVLMSAEVAVMCCCPRSVFSCAN